MDFFSDAGSIPAISTIKRPNADGIRAFSFSYKEPQAMLVGESSTSVEQKNARFN